MMDGSIGQLTAQETFIVIDESPLKSDSEYSVTQPASTFIRR